MNPHIQLKRERDTLLAAAEAALKSTAGHPKPAWYEQTLAAVSQINGHPTACTPECWFCSGDGHFGGMPCPMSEEHPATTQGSNAA